jgi:hypothetical protein
MRFRRLLVIVFACAGCNAGASFALPETADGGAVTAGGATLDAGITATGTVAVERGHAVAAERVLAVEPKPPAAEPEEEPEP